MTQTANAQHVQGHDLILLFVSIARTRVRDHFYKIDIVIEMNGVFLNLILLKVRPANRSDLTARAPKLGPLYSGMTVACTAKFARFPEHISFVPYLCCRSTFLLHVPKQVDSV